MGVGTSTPTSKLTVNGEMSITGSILPGASLTYSLGSATHRWEELYLGTGSVHLGPTCKISTNEASGTIVANKPFVVEGGLILSSSAYINWSSTTGSSGYGLRDNGGTVEFRSTGGTWLPVGTGGSGKLIRNRNAIVTHYTVTSNDNIIGVNATASLTISLPDPSTLTVGQCFLFKDEAGNAGTHNITINTRAGTADRVDGGTSITMIVDDTAVNLYTDGSSKYFIY